MWRNIKAVLKKTHKSREGEPCWHYRCLRSRESQTLLSLRYLKTACWRYRELCLVGMVVRACNPSTLGVEAQGLEVQGHPWPHSKFKVRPYKTLSKHKTSGRKNPRVKKESSILVFIWTPGVLLWWPWKFLGMGRCMTKTKAHTYTGRRGVLFRGSDEG